MPGKAAADCAHVTRRAPPPPRPPRRAPRRAARRTPRRGFASQWRSSARTWPEVGLGLALGLQLGLARAPGQAQWSGSRPGSGVGLVLRPGFGFGVRSAVRVAVSGGATRCAHRRRVLPLHREAMEELQQVRRAVRRRPHRLRGQRDAAVDAAMVTSDAPG